MYIYICIYIYIYIYIYVYICVYVYIYVLYMCVCAIPCTYLWFAVVVLKSTKYKRPVSTRSEHVSRKASLIVQHLVVDHHFSFRQFFAVLCPYFWWIIHRCSPFFTILHQVWWLNPFKSRFSPHGPRGQLELHPLWQAAHRKRRPLFMLRFGKQNMWGVP